MEKWSVVKEAIDSFKQLSEIESNWAYRYKRVKSDFYKMSKEELSNIAENDSDKRVRDVAKDRLGILEKYDVRVDFNNLVTIKLVIPGGCNARCKFCYINDYDKDKCGRNGDFLKYFEQSLADVIIAIDGSHPVSLDITGNEPTIDDRMLTAVLDKIRKFHLRDKIARVTLSTNGYMLDQVIPYLKGSVDYVNISVHHYDRKDRSRIFGMSNAPSSNEYKELVLKLIDVGIDASAVCVIHEDIENFIEFQSNFISWCKDVGFISLRFRKDVFWESENFEYYMNQSIEQENISLIQMENSNDSHWCRLSDDEGFFIFFLNGVKDTTEVSRGIEYIIHDDGWPYIDFYKRMLFYENKLPVEFIFDSKECKDSKKGD